jgi:HPt (histidine-containing phosphotransfer) domain-containing protein
MRQAIVVFDCEGKVGSISSRQANVLFQREILQGAQVRDLLYPGAPAYDVNAEAFTEWVDMAFSATPDTWASWEQYAPREAVLVGEDRHETPIELEFRPLIRDGAIAQLMLLATDVSRERSLQHAVRSQEMDHARRLSAMRRMIAGGTEVLLGFVESARERLDRCDALLRETSPVLQTGTIDELFRHAHTIRGEARSFDLAELADATAGLEDELSRLRTSARNAGHVLVESSRAALEAGLARARHALQRGREALVAASPAGALVLDQTTVCRSALRELSELAASSSDRIRQLVGRLASVPLGVAAAGVVESAPTWAALEGNSVVVSVEARELLIPEALARPLPSVLMHLVRNAVAHGIEPPAERRRAGKPDHGTIRIVGEEVSRGVRVTVEDDGRGLDAARLLERVRGTPIEGQNATELVFRAGVSTRDSRNDVAGHGVGLDAVRSDLASVGYDAILDFAAGVGTRVTIVPKDVRHGLC